MDDHSGSMKLICYSFYLQSRFLMKQKRGRLLSFASVILALSLMIFTDISSASEDDSLLKSASTENLSKVRALLKKGINVDAKDNVGVTALMIASEFGREKIVQALLDKGAQVNHQRKDGYTALIIASQEGNESVVRVLLDRGAKINYQAKNGVTALIIASQEGHEVIVQTLLARGAKVNIRENGGGTALEYAETQKIKKLLKASCASE